MVAAAASRLLAVGERVDNGIATTPAEVIGDVAAVLSLAEQHAEDRGLLRACQHTLAAAVDLRTQHLRNLRDVLTANRRLEEKICAADAQIDVVQAQNDALEAELMRIESAKAPPTPPPDCAESAESPAELLARLGYMNACAIKIQRVWRGWLGRRRALREAMLITSGGGDGGVL